MTVKETMSKTKSTTPTTKEEGRDDDNVRKSNVSRTTRRSNTLCNRFFFFMVAGIIPYMIGYYLSNNNLLLMNKLFQPILDPIIPHVYEKLISYRILSSSTFNNEQQKQETNNKNYTTTTSTLSVDDYDPTICYEKFLKIVTTNDKNNDDDNPFRDVRIVLHRNGEAVACGESNADLSVIVQSVLAESSFRSSTKNRCTDSLFEGKYPFESLLTSVLHKAITSCTSLENDEQKSISNSNSGLLGFCDQGERRTVILPDHPRLVRIQDGKESYLPCHFHNEYGKRITSLSQLTQLIRNINTHTIDGTNNNTTQQHEDCTINVDGTTTSCEQHHTSVDKELHLYAVPAGRLFIHAPAYIGQIIPLQHVVGGLSNESVYMKVISVEPKIFDIMNFFSKEESIELVDRILQETRETHRVKRSSTGAKGYNLNQRRTSESGYDTDGETAMKLKRRGFDLLGFDEYIDSFSDGLQILRYNVSKAYIPHLDWIDGNDQLEHNYESEFKGGNRYATILLYFTDIAQADGGETVFTEAWPDDVPVENRQDLKTALAKLRESPQGSVLERDSWEEELAAKCRSRLAIQPQSARAVLFYSQLPNGKPDKKSRHGGCPVLTGTKYAANLWVWNSPRDGYPGNPKNPNFKGEKKAEEKEHPGKVNGIFRNSGTDPTFAEAELYYVDQYWGRLGHGDDDISVNTYPSHVWNVKVNGETKKTFTITSSEPKVQEYVI